MNALTVGTSSAVSVTSSANTRVRTNGASEGEASSDDRGVGGNQPASAQKGGQATDVGALRDLVHKANAVIDAVGSGLRFRIDDATGSVVVKVVDQASGDVIRQIPSEDMLALKQRLEGWMPHPKAKKA